MRSGRSWSGARLFWRGIGSPSCSGLAMRQRRTLVYTNATKGRASSPTLVSKAIRARLQATDLALGVRICAKRLQGGVEPRDLALGQQHLGLVAVFPAQAHLLLLILQQFQ